jgi:hypothetical protein
VATRIVSATHFKAYVSVPTSPTFFAWVFTYGGEIRMMGPEDVVRAYHDMAKVTLN